MSDSKFKIFKFAKIIISSLLIAVLVLFTAASIRTLSLDVNVGLQLSHWEKTNNISLVIDQHQREELLANFKEAIRIPTVSFSETEINTTALREFDSLLRKGMHFPAYQLEKDRKHLEWMIEEKNPPHNISASYKVKIL